MFFFSLHFSLLIALKHEFNFVCFNDSDKNTVMKL